MHLKWIQPQEGETTVQSLQLDIVGFLAILGEGSVLANAQVSMLSKWIFLPRLIPAPQALMRPARPKNLESIPGKVTGIFSGNHRDSINHIGNLVCDASGIARHSVRVVSISRDSYEKDVKAKSVGPLTFVLLLGFALSVLLLGLSIWQRDGMSILATILLSLLSSLIGTCNKWTLQLPQRKKQGTVPRGDVVIEYSGGRFLVVRCAEEVARELYFAPENVNYWLKHEPAYRIFSLVGTTMLMGGVICLANARIETQIAWAASYMLLGASYWVVAALPGKLHWDCSCYTVKNEALSDSDAKLKGYPSQAETFTQTLWRAIVVAKNTDWVIKSNACPDTEAWRDWLNAAREVAKNVKLADQQLVEGVNTWEVPSKDQFDAQGYLLEMLEQQAKKDEKSVKGGMEDV